MKNLIRHAASKNALKLLVAPSSVKQLTKRSAKSLAALDDDRRYQTTTSQLLYNPQEMLLMDEDGSALHHQDEHNKLHSWNSLNYESSKPTDPWPRKKKKATILTYKTAIISIFDQN